ncbi:MAG: LysE family transporter [Endomicrobium sp.]|jgi:threonine/homoserine/homoserine lactone efflux protein|nr:LysE family transporter [Endomicrobium sp.]
MNPVTNINKLFWSGLKIGLLLQIGGIGPICMIVFRLSLSLPVSRLLIGIIGITLADFIYVSFSVFSISAIMKKMQHYQRVFDVIVGCVLIIFGVLFITTGHVINSDSLQGHDLFLGLFGLTIVNPITIIFIMGIFSLELSKRSMSLRESSVFALGFLLATPLFMIFIVFVGCFIGKILPVLVVHTLNSIMGFVLVFLGLKNIFLKNKNLNLMKG